MRTVVPCSTERAESITGYKVGGTSPFGTKTAIPIYMEETLAMADEEDEAELKPEDRTIWINGGGRGFLVSLKVGDLMQALSPALVNVAITKFV